jgi:integrase
VASKRLSGSRTLLISDFKRLTSIIIKINDTYLKGAYVSDSLENMLITARKRLASSFCNPRLRRIHFHTLRHWAITAYAHKVKDPFLVQQFSRHKDIKGVMKYVHYGKIIYQQSGNDGWTVRATKLLKKQWNY